MGRFLPSCMGQVGGGGGSACSGNSKRVGNKFWKLVPRDASYVSARDLVNVVDEDERKNNNYAGHRHDSFMLHTRHVGA
jgi:hypothetical protein